MLYATIDGGPLNWVANLHSWCDFTEWADIQGYGELAHLAQHGFATELLLLADQIHFALIDDRPEDNVVSVAENVEDICRKNWKAELLIITDGLYEILPDDGSDDGDSTARREKGKKSTKKGAKKVKSGPKKTVTKKTAAKAVAAKKTSGKKTPTKKP